MNSLRIALLTHSVNPRGGVVHTLELATALTALGHDVTVFAPAAPGETLFRLPPCRVVYAPITLLQASTVAMVEARIHAFKQTLMEHDAWSFDVLHAQDSISGNALAELRAQGLIRGFMRTVHHLDHFDDPRLAAWQRRAYEDAEQVLCVSDTWTREMRSTFGIAALTVPNGVDIARFTPHEDAHDAQIRRRLGIDGGRVVLSVGGIEARKNTLALLEAFALVLRTLPGAQLVIAGGASLLDHDAYARSVLKRAAELGLSIGPDERVVVTGPLEDAAMPALFRSADVLSMVSLREGFGLVVLEALASGTPAVASAIAPFTEYLDDSTCYWANPTDVESIAVALLRALSGSGSRIDFEQAVPRLLARFSWAASARRHVDVYRQLLAARALAIH
ncbi:MSMEG_0565 family glycosyltransferase [Paraburkholderia nemoris]|uniref:Mannosylfructose-phosphate synthase n=1 Tax=Paraburkholderia nemoris TaxID=2793076 RepID=A0ABM8RAX1_9BURK|nr:MULTISPECIES: MSMEG_0565 family glycosyltransferase [Paraburkholderia]KPD16094.1 glycosyl transferase family 1 [Burkholderia sp. ST111]MBK5147992.1 MSMEG_0565 family glycosyltransferase [Burkholderia sp. R-69608]MBK3810940.1 MSMEG_0565 family glycosyltransferase [Paraburkholderia aspalathi]CAE6742505.1 Mannosylfructose-phosphate synthase [Paraburkholderia nemoris]CAE6753247.1 Mannosylfructose-phosphate synthase [Paraburkholderia nemoris]